MFESFSFIFLVAALLTYVNYRWLKWPSTIGLMALALVVSTVVTVSRSIVPEFYDFVCEVLAQADFKTLLLEVMLSLLLFAGAIHIDLGKLKKERWSVLLFATLGVLISTVVIGSLFYFASNLLGIDIPFLHSLLFGALISPTDPVAVISILKKANVGDSLELKIEGESLFNDGVGVVVFTGILLLAEANGSSSGAAIAEEVGFVFLAEAVGGLVFGLVLGWLALRLMKSVQENGHLVVLLSLAAVLGGHALALKIGTSGPLAMVVAGLYIGNGLNHDVFMKESKDMMNGIWSVIDESLNAVLFVLIGLSAHLLEFDSQLFTLGIIAIVILLIGRAVSVILPSSLLKHNKKEFWPSTGILIWGGLRGGISLALAMSLSDELHGLEIFSVTFIVVVFSILVQGLSLGRVVKKLSGVLSSL
ncbi:MAG: cation:proton antiporter [Saprospiraceae bacterium]